jgi:hypothetical protein
MSGKRKKNIDPLFQLFEHHLLSKSYEDSTAFTKEVAAEYLGYLDSTPAHIPFQFRGAVLEDLESETHQMLVKKMYGCVSINDHLNYGKVILCEIGNELKTFELESKGPEAPPKKS